MIAPEKLTAEDYAALILLRGLTPGTTWRVPSRSEIAESDFRVQTQSATNFRPFMHWRTTPPPPPVVTHNAAVVVALDIANLRGPERPTLELHALQEAQHIETVTRYLMPIVGHPDIAEHALERWLYPHVYRGGTFAEGARALRMRKHDYGLRVGLGVTRLREWLHSASLKFLRTWSSNGAAGTENTKETL